MQSPAKSSARVALVTGAARGIGLAIARRLAADGLDLELCDRDEAGLSAAARALAADGRPVHAATVDLRDRAARAAYARELTGRRPRLDVLVLNAGVGGPDPEDEDAALAHLREVVEVNAGSAHALLRDLARALPDDGSGRVVLVASLLGRIGVPGFSAYCASKAAAIGLARAAAADLARRRVTVNAVCPGWTDTAMAEQGFRALARDHGGDVAAARRAVEAGLPLGRIARPEEVAALVAHLSATEAGAITGQTFTIACGDG